MQDLKDVWSALKLVPGYMATSWSSIPVFTLGYFAQLSLQDVSVEGIPPLLWNSATQGLLQLFNHSYFNIYEETEVGIDANAEALKALGKQLPPNGPQIQPMPIPATMSLTSLHPPVNNKTITPNPSLVTFGPTQLVEVKTRPAIPFPPQGPPQVNSY